MNIERAVYDFWRWKCFNEYRFVDLCSCDEMLYLDEESLQLRSQSQFVKVKQDRYHSVEIIDIVPQFDSFNQVQKD